MSIDTEYDLGWTRTQRPVKCAVKVFTFIFIRIDDYVMISKRSEDFLAVLADRHEGLPKIVTLSLALQIVKSSREKLLVSMLTACERLYASTTPQTT